MRNTVRTFVAIELPPEIRSRAERLIALLRGTSTRVRWVGSNELHWTLKFLGEVDLNDIPDVCRKVAQAAAGIEPFDVDAHGAGAFPDPLRPRTIWMGVGEGTNEMISLHDAIEAQLATSGFRKEQRRFRPHITLGRARNSDEGLSELAELIRQQADFDGGISTVYEVAVFASHPGPKGPTYEALGHAPLGGE
jgi:RNA 2',3'-cyclic 3'-phosphodiesterase